MGYDGDSFFTLGMGGRIGLVLLSAVLMILCAGLVWKLVDGLGRVWRVLVALGLFWGFIWLSPQIYYAYYWMIFEDLPVQVVIGGPPGLGDILRLVSFTDRASLAHHGQGVFAWMLMILALLRRRPKSH